MPSSPSLPSAALVTSRLAVKGQHRGQHHDPVGDALQTVWALGHVAVLGLLSVSAQHQLAGHPAVAASAPDIEPATHNGATASTWHHL